MKCEDMKLEVQNKGIILPYKIPEELKHPLQLQKGMYEASFGEIGKLLDVIIDPIVPLVNMVMPILYKLTEAYMNTMTNEEIENFIWLSENQKYWGW